MRFTLLVASSVALAASLAPCSGQTPAPQKKSSSVWVPAPAGSFLGGGYVDAGEAAPPKVALLRGEPEPLARAVNELNAQSGTQVQGHFLIGPAVARQSGVPVETLKAQHAKTNLSYGELLVANSIAKASNKPFSLILSERMHGATWTSLSTQHGVIPESIAKRARVATESIRFAQGRRDIRREQNLQDSGLGFGHGNHVPGF